MLNWQGINWREGNWDKEEWRQLAQLLNVGQEFDWLRIQYPYLHYDTNTNQWYEFPRDAISDAHWYERARVQRAVYHEGLFIIFLACEAGFSDKYKAWMWIQPPNESGESVNTLNLDTLAKGECHYQPSILKTSHGNLLRLGEDTIIYPNYSYRVDPLFDVKYKGSADGLIYGGLFLVPPDYEVKLSPEQVKYL